MPFPEVKRVIYKKNPLDRVICQLRFAPILKIDAEIPADFQEMIRADFPNYSEKMTHQIDSLKQGNFRWSCHLNYSRVLTLKVISFPPRMSNGKSV